MQLEVRWAASLQIPPHSAPPPPRPCMVSSFSVTPPWGLGRGTQKVPVWGASLCLISIVFSLVTVRGGWPVHIKADLATKLQFSGRLPPRNPLGLKIILKALVPSQVAQGSSHRHGLAGSSCWGRRGQEGQTELAGGGGAGRFAYSLGPHPCSQLRSPSSIPNSPGAVVRRPTFPKMGSSHGQTAPVPPPTWHPGVLTSSPPAASKAQPSTGVQSPRGLLLARL